MNDYWSTNDEILNGKRLWEKLNKNTCYLVDKENNVISSPYELNNLRSVFLINDNDSKRQVFWKIF